MTAPLPKPLGETIAVTTRFRGMTARTVIIDLPKSRGYGTAFIARKLIEPRDLVALGAVFYGETITLHIAAWKAREVGFR
jgi:hypothetical protein